MNIDAKSLAAQLAEVLRLEGVHFIQENKESVLKLGEDMVSAVFSAAILNATPIPNLPDFPSMDAVADREAVIARRSEVNQLIAAAQLEHAMAIMELRDKAKARAVSIGGSILGVALAALRGAIGG